MTFCYGSECGFGSSDPYLWLRNPGGLKTYGSGTLVHLHHSSNVTMKSQQGSGYFLRIRIRRSVIQRIRIPEHWYQGQYKAWLELFIFTLTPYLRRTASMNCWRVQARLPRISHLSHTVTLSVFITAVLCQQTLLIPATVSDTGLLKQDWSPKWLVSRQCCGSAMFIPDQGSACLPSQIRIFPSRILDPHQII